MTATRVPAKLRAFRFGRAWLVAPLVVIIAQNAVYYPATEAKTSTDRTYAIKPLPQRDVLAYGLEQPQSNWGSKYSPAVAIAEIAPGSTVTVVGATDDDYEVALRRLLGFGQAGAVKRVDAPTQAVVDAAHSGVLVAEAGAGAGGPAWQVWLSEPLPGDPVPSSFLVDIFTAGQRVEHVGGPALDLVWVVGEDGVLVIADASLLPESLLASLDLSAR